MQRARETCEIVGLAGQAKVDQNLREWDYGIYEGKTTKEIREGEPDWSVWTSQIVGGESLAEVGARADGVIARAQELGGSNGNVALFAHAHILRILAARYIGLGPEGGSKLGLSTGSVSVLGWERETRVIESWNRSFD
jgi:probable phosphoglycerate mutase